LHLNKQAEELKRLT